MNTERKRGGRIPKLNPKSHHVMLRFDDDEWMKFLVMYEQTDVKAKAVFAKARIFGFSFGIRPPRFLSVFILKWIKWYMRQ